MRILTVSDKVEPVLYGPYIRERVGQIDLILACGDLPYYYLEYIVSLLDRPLYYVHGNHDKAIPHPTDMSLLSGPASLGWAVNLHLRTVRFQGLLLAGLEGCRAYNPGTPYQYDESQVRAQILRLGLRLLANRRATGVTWMSSSAMPRRAGFTTGKTCRIRGLRAICRCCADSGPG